MDPIKSKCHCPVSIINLFCSHHGCHGLGLTLGGVVGFLATLNTCEGVGLTILLSESSTAVPMFLAPTVVAVVLDWGDSEAYRFFILFWP